MSDKFSVSTKAKSILDPTKLETSRGRQETRGRGAFSQERSPGKSGAFGNNQGNSRAFSATK